MEIASKIRVIIVAAFFSLIGLIALGTVAYHYLEGWSWISSFYFSITTLTTVGFGDLHPTTEISRLFTAIYVLLGVAIAFATLGGLGTTIRRKSKIK
ncbi:MAG: potassium channel family protein [Methanobacteriota archaeon]